jgi:hypothetical protein
MDPATLGATLSTIREYLPLFFLLLFGLPIITFVAITFWIAGRSAKVQRTTNWFVPTDLESDAARMHFSMQHNSTDFTRQRRRAARGRNSSPRRKA